MVCLISMLSAIFCSLFSWIKSFGKLLTFPTIGWLWMRAIHTDSAIGSLIEDSHVDA
jgi:hypothetical protein